MTVGVVDTTVLVHLLRHKPEAFTWFNSQTNQLSVTPISWLEIMFGAGSKDRQQQGLSLLNRFDMEFLIESDMRWAMQQMQNYRLSHGIGIMDCLIASACYRLQIPLYTHNLKHMSILLGNSLTVMPY